MSLEWSLQFIVIEDTPAPQEENILRSIKYFTLTAYICIVLLELEPMLLKAFPVPYLTKNQCGFN